MKMFPKVHFALSMRNQLSLLAFILAGAIPLLADSKIPLSYIPHRVVGVIEGYVPGAQRLVYKVEAYYGQSNAKVTLKVTRGREIVGRDYD
jgi:hypothetical protein